ncbi:hexose transporter [Trypanosoma brucei brucei TREU927]|uniref:Hexose transporter n=1 Tax=Trypanosoma brucei brucei (strain 927/4 GUTat10.1) TaxID=185431 RepID=Q38AC0_TRYB2|nr:hexose transporter [Trypanosoma brucei brucei TREU927]EAN78250.1 hexose transporter [Trypanosoma brucei brucei TREU927]
MTERRDNVSHAPDAIEGPNDGAHAEDTSPGFFSFENLGVAQVQVVGGTLNGYVIGYVAVYLLLYLTATECKFTTEGACGGAKIYGCKWSGTTCKFENPKCSEGSDPSDSCKNEVAYTSVYSGIFACAMIVGSMVGSIIAGKCITTFGLKKSFIIVSVTCTIACVVVQVAIEYNNYYALCTGRVLIGLGVGILCSVCPMYVNENAHPKLCKMDGVLFQVFTTLGIMLAAMLGLILDKTGASKEEANMAGRLHVFSAVPLGLSVAMFLVGMFLRESTATFSQDDDGKADGGMDPNEYGWGQMLWPLFMGAVTAGTLQLTGINAVMNYAPKITENLGMDPSLGNFLVMAWNFVTSLAAIPLASRFTMRQMFITCSFVASCMCLFLCGIPVFPGVAEEKVKNGVATTGIALFIAAFEFGVGSCFFVLAQDLFPPSFRPKGGSFVVMMQFIFNILINLLYPITTEAISGGPTANQDKGQAVAFILFGLIGLICSVLQFFYLYPYDANQDHENDHGGEPVEQKTYPVEASPRN